MDRRKFLALAAGSAALGTLFVLQGCSSSDSDSTDTPTTPDTTTYTVKYGKVSSNHGHTFKLSAAQQEAGVETRVYSYGADHSHKLVVTAEDLATIVAGTEWSKESSMDAGHSHTVTFN